MRNLSGNSVSAWSSLLFWALQLGAPASAQSTINDPGDIIVTAQRREERIMDVGISTAAYERDELKRLGVVDSLEVINFTPGVFRSASAAGENSQFVVRGAVLADFKEGLEAPVAVYIDEAYVSQARGQTFGLFDLERIEVLKGPQGTLFGRNATGGLVHYITRKPSDTTDGYLDVSYASYNDMRAEGAFGGPFSDTVSGRISFLYRDFGPLLDNHFPGGEDFWGEETKAGRAQLRFAPSAAVDINLSIFGSDADSDSAPYQSGQTIKVCDAQGRWSNTLRVSLTETRIAIGPNGENFLADCAGPSSALRPVPGGDFFGYRDEDGLGLDTSSDASRQDAMNFSTYGATLNAAWEISEKMALVSITDFRKFERSVPHDADGGPVSLFEVDTDSENEQFSQELRLSGSGSFGRWVAGAYFLYIHNAGDLVLIIPPIGLGFSDTVDKDTHSTSLFGQVDYAVSKRITLIGGARVIFERQSFDYLTETLAASSGAVLAPGITFKDKFNETLWAAKAQVEWRPNDDLLLYAGFNRGVKAGSFNELLAIDPLIITAAVTGDLSGLEAVLPFKAETLHAYEAGFKATMLDATTQVTGAIFYHDYQDQQIFQFVGLSGAVTNAEGTSWGAELNISSKPVRGLTLQIGAAGIDAKVKNLLLNGIVRDVEPAFTPSLQLTGLLRYEWPLFGGTMSLQADANYTDSFYIQVFNFDAQRVDAYVIANARLGYQTSDSGFGVTVFVKNIGSTKYLTSAFDFADVCGCQQDGRGLPRWIGASLRFQW